VNDPQAATLYANESTSVRVRLVPGSQLDGVVPALAAIFSEVIASGAPLGFLAPFEQDDARDYFRSLRPELDAGTRLLMVAFDQQRIVGSGQLMMPLWPIARHRAEVQKLFVARSARGRGVGQALMAALHESARLRGRSLLILNTRRGDPAERFYKMLGYREVGVVPGYYMSQAGKRHDNVSFYREAVSPSDFLTA